MKQWRVAHKVKIKSEKLKIEEIVDILLSNRGIKTAKEIHDFLNSQLESVTFKPVGIKQKDVDNACERIKLAVKNNEAIVIYGDYDVDGICGTAILWETIYSFYKNVHPYIPHRVDEGYGLSEAGIKNLKYSTASQAKIKKCGLIITVDNGIVATKAVDYAREQGIDVIISDHHVKGSTLPKAHSIIHSVELCGTGVAYLLSKAISNFQFPISNQFSKQQFTNEKYLELVALATVADLVPLNKFNRALLKHGLESLRKTKRPGLLALFKEAKLDAQKIGTYEIGHMIAPRLNASGRISHAMDSLRLVCTTDPARANKLARHLGEVNSERQQLTVDLSQDAINQVKSQKSKVKSLIIAESSEYEQGVIGLIASRLVEEFYRPAIAISVGEVYSKGSARSIAGVNIIELIRSSSDLLKEAGGHPMAAGFTIETAKLEEFKKELQKTARTINKKLFNRVLKIDLELPFELINLELLQAISVLEPFGMGNPVPVFATRGVTIVQMRNVGNSGQHVQILFEQTGKTFKGILFSFDSGNFHIGDVVDIAYTLQKNEWNGKTTIDLKIKSLFSSV